MTTVTVTSTEFSTIETQLAAVRTSITALSSAVQQLQTVVQQIESQMSIIMSAQPMPIPVPPASPVAGPPVIIGSPFSFSVALPVTIGESVGSQLTATNSPTSWSVTSNPGNCFAITNAGQLYVTTVDVIPQSYGLTVQATNAAGSGSASVTVTVTTSGTIYYVATTGNDSNNGLTPNTPFLTFSKAASVATTAGSAVLFMSGTYAPTATMLITSGGSSSHQTIYGPYQQAVVTLSGTNMTGSGNNIVKSQANYVSVIGMTITTTASGTNTNSGFFTAATTGNRLVNCSINNTYNTGVYCNGSNHAILNNIVNNTCLNNLNAPSSGVNWGEGIQLNGDNGSGQPAGYVGGLVSGNLVYDNWGEGIGIARGMSGVTVSGNRIYDNYSVLLYNDGSQNVTYVGNLVYSTGATQWGHASPSGRPYGIAFARESSADGTVSGIKCYSNIVVGADIGIAYFNYLATGGMQNSIIANNTCVNNATNSLTLQSDAGSTGNLVENNIFYGANPTGSVTGYTCDYNDWFSANSSAFAGAHDISGNPAFVGAAGSFVGADYQLNSSSPCKLAGINLYSSGVTSDFGGNVIPSSVAFTTIGAWQ